MRGTRVPVAISDGKIIVLTFCLTYLAEILALEPMFAIRLVRFGFVRFADASFEFGEFNCL
jgi:hypothetical protein